MKKFDLTPAGVQALLSELYQLPDAELQEKANAFAVDLKGQVAYYFILLPEQVAFLLAIDAQTTAFMASSVAIAVANRLPIRLEKPAQTTKRPDPPAKVIETTPKITAGYGSDGEVIAEGEVVIVIRYDH